MKKKISKILSYVALLLLFVVFGCWMFNRNNILHAPDALQAAISYSVLLSFILSIVSLALQWRKNTIAKWVLFLGLIIIVACVCYAVALAGALGPWMG